MSFVAAAVVGSAVIGGGISAAASSSASKRAAAVSRETTATNNALSRDIFNQNSQTLAPFVAQGGAATSYINQLLGIQTAPAQGGGSQPMGGAMSGGSSMAGGGAMTRGRTGEDFAFNGEGGDPNMGFNPQSPVQFGQGGMGGGGVGNSNLAPGSAANAFDAFRNSTGYQFRLGEGQQAITNNKAVSGLLNSGSALKDLTRFGQDFGSAEFGNYLGQLNNQQGVGLSAASAQAGVANNYSAQVQGNNNNNATNQGNAAFAKANAISNAISGVTSTAGFLAGMKMK